MFFKVSLVTSDWSPWNCNDGVDVLAGRSLDKPKIITAIYFRYGAITQLVECHNGIVEVSGSNPLSSI